MPWHGAYRSTAMLKGKRRFVLGASGHIAGVINPPLKKKRSHWIAKSAALPASPEAWLAGRSSTRAAGGPTGPLGSRRSAASRSPRRRSRATGKYKAIEPAPGAT